MSLLYIECNAGVAGDMLCGALLDALPAAQAKEALRLMNGLGLPGVSVQAERAETCGVVGAHVRVLVDGAEERSYDAHGHEHGGEHHHHGHDHAGGHHHHEHRSLGDIEALIGGFTTLPQEVRANAAAVYRSIAEAEAAVHGTTMEHIHFHEVGTLDAVVDVTFACLLMHLLTPSRVVASPVRTGFGEVRCAHGVLPVPAPATARLLRGVPSYAGDLEGEFCTPTGAALIGHFADEFGQRPPMAVERTGYGVGTKRFPVANCVRAFVGEEVAVAGGSGCAAFDRRNGKLVDGLNAEAAKEEGAASRLAGAGAGLGFDGESAGKEGEVPGTGRADALDERCSDEAGADDEVLELCCNLDDMTGEDVAFACEQLMAAGALDVWTVSIGMKKGRPGVMLCALCAPERAGEVEASFFRHTTTLGVRRRAWQRTTLQREVFTVETPLGPVRQKVARTSDGSIARAKWEHDDLEFLAREHGMSLQEVRNCIGGA